MEPRKDRIDEAGHICGRCQEPSTNDFGDGVRLYMELNRRIISMRFICDDCVWWTIETLKEFLEKAEKNQ